NQRADEGAQSGDGAHRRQRPGGAGAAPRDGLTKKNRSGPVSRVLFPRGVSPTRAANIPLGPWLPRTSTASDPGDGAGSPCSAPGGTERSLLALAPGGVCRADQVTLIAVRSYRTVSPLPRGAVAGVPWRSIFCGTVLRLAPTGR